MVYFIGSGGSDYLDFIGDISEPKVLAALLDAARARVSDFQGFHFYHVPEHSRTGDRLRLAAESLGLTCLDEEGLPAPLMDLAGMPDTARAAVNKKRLLKYERSLTAEGPLEVRHFTDGAEILPQLDVLFAQHMARWDAKPRRSRFHDRAHRRFYEGVAQAAARTGWLRFTRVDWAGQPIALHFGFCYQGSFMYYTPTFDVAAARRSPGQVLLKHVLSAAIDEGAAVFDFGLGDEEYKYRFATHVRRVRSWGLYPSGHPRTAWDRDATKQN
jgi:CelD/BcsL family acetyltransferase involved in cellulose biosynthesis